MILYFAPETNGEVAYRAYKSREREAGLTLVDLAEDNRGVRYDFEELKAQPRRILTSPCGRALPTTAVPTAPIVEHREADALAHPDRAPAPVPGS